MAVVPRSEREQLGVDPSEEEVAARQAAEETARQEEEARAAAEAEASQRPEWLPEKFKTPEDLVRSYGSLENELRTRGEREREMADRMSQLEQMAAQAQEQPRAQADDPRAVYAAEVQAAIDAGDGQRLAELQEWHTQWTLAQAFADRERSSDNGLEPLRQNQNLLTAAHVKRSVMEEIPEFSQYEAQVGELLQAEPWRMPDEVLDNPAAMAKALVATYEAVKFKDLVEQQRALEEAGVTTADLQRARKLGAQTLSGANGKAEETSAADRQLDEINQALKAKNW